MAKTAAFPQNCSTQELIFPLSTIEAIQDA